MRSNSSAPSISGETRITPPPLGDRLRVLICIEALGVGGKERQAVELIKGLTWRSDIDCHVVCFGTQDFYLDQIAGLGIPVDFTSRRVRWDVCLFHTLSKTIKQYQPHL